MSWIVTSWMIFLWTLLLPVAPFIKQSNCWYHVTKNRILWGGKITVIKSKRWSGHHFVWTDRGGETWEYTVKKMPRFTPWWKLVLYSGVERKVRYKV